MTGSGLGRHPPIGQTAGMSETLLAWAVLIFGYLLPILHVALSPRAGAWRPPPGARCPLGPRVGWLVFVVLLGPVGWVLFIWSRARRAARLQGPGRDGSG
jgi:hypothetical protein